MPIRIQPKEIEIPPDDPFAYDLLGRRQPVEVFTRLITDVEGPCAVALDAAWGAGKTTFLKMWAQHLRNEHYPVVEFNAWETDASGDPFLALSTEITSGLRDWGKRPVGLKIQRTEMLAKQVLRRTAPGALRFAASFVPVVGGELGHVAGSWAEDALSGYAEAKRTVRQYRSSLEEMAVAHWGASSHKPVVVFIDELDRCRPSYAVELLETAKHIFSVEHMVFVLAVNRSELAHSVRALYGEGFGAGAYLRRFFDVDFRLPPPDRQQFIDGLLDSVGVPDFFGQLPHMPHPGLFQDSVEALREFFSQPVFTLRDVGQAVHRFGLVLSSLSLDEFDLIRALTVLIIVESLDPILYRRLADHDETLTDEEAVEAVFTGMDRVGIRHSESGRFVEAVIIGSMLRNWDHNGAEGEIPARLPLYGLLHSAMDGATLPAADASEEERSNFQLYGLLRFMFEPYGVPLNFDLSVRRFELLSGEFRVQAGPAAYSFRTRVSSEGE